LFGGRISQDSQRSCPQNENIQIANEIIRNPLNLKTKYSFHDFKKHFKDENEDQPP
jgi:hypothetical protein